MPATRKSPATRPKKATTQQLARELAAVMADVALLQKRYRTLVHLVCPKEWLTEEVDDDELWAKAIWKPSLKEVIEKLK